MVKRVCTWCSQKRISERVEIVISRDHEARYWCCFVCIPCQYALQDLLDDASRRAKGGTKMLGWWEDNMLYDLDGTWSSSRVALRPDQEPPAAS